MKRNESIREISDRIYRCFGDLVACKQDLEEVGRLGKYVKRLDSTCGKLDNLIREIDEISK